MDRIFGNYGVGIGRTYKARYTSSDADKLVATKADCKVGSRRQ